MTTRFISLSLTTVAEPVHSGGDPSERHLAALAFIILEQTDTGWIIRLRSAAIGAGDGEARLLAWATEQFPVGGVAICWRLVDDLVAPLVAAARDADPEVAIPLLDRLDALVAAPTVDLALEHGGRAATPFADIMAASGIPLVTLSEAEIESAWAFGDTGQLKQHASAQAVALLRLWLAGAPSDEFPAKAAFTRWLAGNGDDLRAEDAQ